MSNKTDRTPLAALRAKAIAAAVVLVTIILAPHGYER
jgi:hypothetical protein